MYILRKPFLLLPYRMIDQSPRVPKYRYLYETLRRQITQGEFRAGDLLPSEKDLRLQYELTKPTIRQALDLLLQDGYIRKHQGKGSIVKPLPLGSRRHVDCGAHR